MYIVNNGINYDIRNDITFLNTCNNYDCIFSEMLNNTHDATHNKLLIVSIYRSPDPILITDLLKTFT